MRARTTAQVLVFRREFSIGSNMAPQPPGSYLLVTEEEQVDCFLHPIYQHLTTSLQLPAIGTPGIAEEFVVVKGSDLYAALDSDSNDITQIIITSDPNSIAARASRFSPEKREVH